MSTPRVIRGTSAKIFLYVCAVLIITGIIACYNNTLSQLDDERKANANCHRQEENLSTQLQMITDYKQKLEKSLKTERAEHQQNKIQLENKYSEEKSKYEQQLNESKLKFNSLQQHYNLLNTKHQDFTEECNGNQQKQVEQISELKEKIKKLSSDKETLKSKVLEGLVNIDDLKRDIEKIKFNKSEKDSQIFHLEKVNHELQREVNSLKEKCSIDTFQEPQINKQLSSVSPENRSKPSENNIKQAAEGQERRVLPYPGLDMKALSSKSTTNSGIKSSAASLNGARPIGMPTVTPESANKNHILFAPIEGPKHLPIVDDVQPNAVDNVQESPNEANNRYGNKVKEQKLDEIEKENGANEVYDHPLKRKDDLTFNGNAAIEQAEKANFNKEHINKLGINNKLEKDQIRVGDYDQQNDAQLEDNEPEDDDHDEYDDMIGKPRDAAIRH